MTDITSITAGYKEPDDGQSLTRLLLYANDFEIEGLLATSNLEHARAIRPDLIREVVEAYGRDLVNLLKHDKRYPTKEYLLSLIKRGNPVAGRAIPLLENIGHGKDTEASEWIIKVVDEQDHRPVWILVWGGSTDLAQALWRVKATRSAPALKNFIARIRVRAIADQDQAGPWIRSNFPGLYFVLQKVNMRGIYRGGDTSFVSPEWVHSNLKNKGALGQLYPIYNGGDIWSRQLGPVRGIKEGDTPSFLSLLPTGLNDEHNPAWISWGGRSKPDSVHNHFVDAVDSLGNFERDPHPTLASVYRWRREFQNDFASRMDWCVKSFDEANHAAQPIVRVSKRIHVWHLDASRTTDPDNNKLIFSWWIDKTASTFKGDIIIEKSNNKQISISPPKVSSVHTLHIILEVSDDGRPALTSYKRIVIELIPQT